MKEKQKKVKSNNERKRNIKKVICKKKNSKIQKKKNFEMQTYIIMTQKRYIRKKKYTFQT